MRLCGLLGNLKEAHCLKNISGPLPKKCADYSCVSQSSLNALQLDAQAGCSVIELIQALCSVLLELQSGCMSSVTEQTADTAHQKQVYGFAYDFNAGHQQMLQNRGRHYWHVWITCNIQPTLLQSMQLADIQQVWHTYGCSS